MPETELPAHTSSMVTVRYWAAARAAAGRTEDQVVGAETVQQVLDEVSRRRPDDGHFARVLAISSFLLGQQPIRREDLAGIPVAGGDVIEVLPPFAGG